MMIINNSVIRIRLGGGSSGASVSFLKLSSLSRSRLIQVPLLSSSSVVISSLSPFSWSFYSSLNRRWQHRYKYQQQHYNRYYSLNRHHLKSCSSRRKRRCYYHSIVDDKNNNYNENNDYKSMGRIFVDSNRNYDYNTNININHHNDSNKDVTTVVDVEVLREWSKSYADKAGRVIVAPPLPLNNSTFYNDDNENDENGEDDSEKSYTNTKTNNSENIFEEYLRWRGWGEDINNIFGDDQQNPTPKSDTNSNENSNREEYLHNHQRNKQSLLNYHRLRARQLVGRALTYPLTLGYHFNEVYLPPDIIDDDDGVEKKHERIIRICCVGARAESTMPMSHWKEALIIANHQWYRHQLKRGKRMPRTTQQTTYRWIIDLVGPEVTLPRKKRQPSSSNSTMTMIQLPKDKFHERGGPHRTIELNHVRKTLHKHVYDLLLLQQQQQQEQHEKKRKIGQDNDNNNNDTKHIHLHNIMKNHWDGFVSFNPGLGYPTLVKSWEKTIKFVLKTNKPWMVTCHSYTDGCRDRLILQRETLLNSMGKEKVVDGMVPVSPLSSTASSPRGLQHHCSIGDYRANPFASPVAYRDPLVDKTVGRNDNNNDDKDNVGIGDSNANDNNKSTKKKDSPSNGRQSHNSHNNDDDETKNSEKDDTYCDSAWVRPNHGVILFRSRDKRYPMPKK